MAPDIHSKDQQAPAPRGGRGSGRRRLLLGAALALFALGAAGETLYRAFWACKRLWAARAGQAGYFSLYAVGESSMAGEPYDPGITPSALVNSMFSGRLQGRPIREFDLARRGDSVYPQAASFERALRTRDKSSPGAVLIYTGNSDAGTGRGMPAPERFREKVLSRSMLLRDLLFYAEKRFRFLRVRTLDTYEHHLRHIVEMSLENGLVPVIATVPSNIADIDPGLLPWPDLPPDRAASILEKGLELEKSRGAAQALSYYSERAAEYPRLGAYLAYRAGKCCQALGRYGEAERYYREAVDLAAPDNFRRATTLQNDFIRGLAAELSVPLVDAVELFARNSPHRLTGNGLFSDGHHPNMNGYLLLAEAFAGKLSEIYREPPRRRFSGPEEVFSYFSYGLDQQAAALVTSGRWLFNASALHALPARRLDLAIAKFKAALLLEPGNFSAWLGLALAREAKDGGLLSAQSGLDWLAKQGVGEYHSGTYSLSETQLEQLLKKLPPGSIPEAVLAQKRPAPEPGGGAPAELLALCSRLAAENKKEAALRACRNAAYAAPAGAAGDGPANGFLRSEASFKAYELLRSLGRPGEADETLFWTVNNAPAAWPGLARAKKELK
ncbi:MAG TPA: hypothetical protein PKI19_07035 [Elusimicrobiales bacterium]|nr:hypothetical protein [Elusimicrobiales bacterium]